MNHVRLIDVQIQIAKLSVAEAEIWVFASIDGSEDQCSLRGRLLGPKCLDRTTIEIAYPLKAFPQKPPYVPNPCAKVIIPEPSLWSAELPFVYQGPIELWANDRLCDRKVVDVRLIKSEK